MQDEVITTSVELPAAKATMLRAGMRLPFRATHLPGFDAKFYWCRVLSCSITPVAAGERYRLTLELAPTGASIAYSVACRAIGVGVTDAGTYEGNHSNITQAPGNLFYLRGGLTYPEEPEIGFEGAWHFPIFDDDAAGDSVGNRARVIVAGGGTLTITVADYEATHTFWAELRYSNTAYHDSWTGLAPGAHVFTIPDDEHCFHFVDIGDDSGAGGKWQFVSWEWEPA